MNKTCLHVIAISAYNSYKQTVMKICTHIAVTWLQLSHIFLLRLMFASLTNAHPIRTFFQIIKEVYCFRVDNFPNNCLLLHTSQTKATEKFTMSS